MNRILGQEDRHFICMSKGSDRYVFVWCAHQRKEILRTFGRFAADKTLSFNWYDAAQLSENVNLLQKMQGGPSAR